MKVTFIGLGIMGSRMASILLKAGVDLTVYNRTPKPAEELGKKGAQVAKTVELAVKDTDIVISMLSSPEAVDEVILQNLHHFKKNAIWMDSTTVNPSFSIKSKNLAEKHGLRFLEAPVAGTKPQAEDGELTFLIGGDKAVLNDVLILLGEMGNKNIHIGEVGKASSFKMVINMLLGMSMVAFVESLKLGEAMGLDKSFLLNNLPSLPVSAPFTKMKAEMIKDDSFDPQFPLDLMYKDMHLVTLTAYENHTALPLTNLAKELYSQANKKGLGRMDMSAIYKFLDKE
jgi:3-hydroxyisobutyrate dehydrogenase/glyoxylate/succinic semialdehyde reductase